MSVVKQQKIDRFWDKYIELTNRYGVSNESGRYYVKHVEAYIKAHPEQRLVEHTPQMLELYLQEIGRMESVKEWQFQQQLTALRILFVELVKPPWANDFPWSYWKVAQELPSNHATIARDAAAPPAAAKSRAELSERPTGQPIYAALFTRLIAEAR